MVEKNKKCEYVLSLSCGKDSLAMLLRVLKEGLPLTKVVFFDTGMEFACIYKILEQVKPLIEAVGAKLVILKPENHWLYDMLLRPINTKDGGEKYGRDWCGGCCRWRTSDKVFIINKYLDSLGEYMQYIGIAYDEPKRVVYEKNKTYPLVEWQMTEEECLTYCYEHGFSWVEEGVELYSILKRVSCWCCANKSMDELRNIYRYLPRYWEMLKGLQSRIARPFRSDGRTIFDLDEQFTQEVEYDRQQLHLWDLFDY